MPSLCRPRQPGQGGGGLRDECGGLVAPFVPRRFAGRPPLPEDARVHRTPVLVKNIQYRVLLAGTSGAQL